MASVTKQLRCSTEAQNQTPNETTAGPGGSLCRRVEEEENER